MLPYIKVRDALYTSGDCYVQQNAPIMVGYYKLKIQVGEAASAFSKTQYTDLAADLKEMGFTDITLLRADDLISGWLTKEGTIKSITIGGNSQFTEKDSFYADEPVVIVVHTFKGRGCDDITEIAK